ncbi:MAG TPA: LuxR C-terminal-related transcriptional regulator [Rubrivivax sp.]|nr:LuxR C-terminal-related transcriptional regulator [Rubrivivax sp.]
MPTPTAPLPDFALAKIQPPRPRVGLVERPALEQALQRALQEQQLLLLVAPAGYGKTAVLTRLIRQLPEGCALAWLCADEDDQLQRFLACLCAALEPYDLPWRMAPDALPVLAQSGHGLRDAAAELVNALAAAELPCGLIVLDDLHRITDPQVFALLQALIERLPERWSVVIASRTEPPLPLARWRVGGELAEFRQDALRFGAAEVAALLRSLPPGLPPPDVDELLQRTEGWPVGLRLSLNVPAGVHPRRLAGVTQRHLFDYLAAEVLDDMPAELRLFLLRCSVLPEMTAARCAHVSGMARSARLLDELERRSLFVSVLQAGELTLRMHDLVRDFLQDRLQRDHASELPALLRRAAEHESDLQRAVSWLARAGAWDEAAALLLQRGEPLFMRGSGAAVEQLLALFPAAEHEARPELQWLHGLAAMQHLDFDAVLAAMQRAAAGFERADREREAVLARAYACLGLQHAGRLDDEAHEVERLLALPLDAPARAFVQCAGVWSAYARAEAEAIAPRYAAMLAALEQSDDAPLWHRCAIVSLLIGLPGMAPLLERFAAGALRAAGDMPSELQCSALHLRAWLAIGRGRLDEAEACLARADEAYRWLGMTRGMNHSNGITHALLDALRGEREPSLAVLQQLAQDLQQHSPASHRRTSEHLVLAAQVQAAWVLQDEPALRAADAALARAANALEWRAAALCRQFSRACVALLDERLDAARGLLEALAQGPNRVTCFLADTARLLLADLLLRQGRQAEAARALRPWLDAVRGGAELAGALFAGAGVRQRLLAADWDGELAPVLAAVLAPLSALNPPPAAPPATSAAAVPGALATLSEREREVLARIARGDSNKLIARAFDLSPHTIKRHVANILDKLGVDTRGQAAARWRDAARGGDAAR